MEPAEKNIALVVNPLHAKARSLAAAIGAMLQQRKTGYTVYTDHWPTDWMDVTEAWIVGGNGTLNYFINRYPQFHLPMAIFRGGTGNDFHRLLYGNLATSQQVDRVLKANPKPVDAGLCNRNLFINGVGIGFEGKVAQDLAAKEKRDGKASYLLTILKNIFRYRSFLCTVSTSGFHWGKKCFLISVANGKRYGGGFRAGSQSLVNDGLLDIIMVGRVPPLLRLRYLPLMEKGKYGHLPLVTYVKSAMVIVKAPEALPAHLDGEAFSATEFNMECLPGRFLFLY